MRTIKVQGRSYELASLMARLGGQFLDGLIYLFILLVGLLLGGLITGWIGPVIGIIAAILYLLFQDGLANGQS